MRISVSKMTFAHTPADLKGLNSIRAKDAIQFVY